MTEEKIVSVPKTEESFGTQNESKKEQEINQKDSLKRLYDTNDTDDTYDTNDTDDTGSRIKRIKRITYQSLFQLLGIGPFEQILALLYTSTPLSYEEIALNSKIDQNYVKTIINRKREYFDDTDKVDGVKRFSVSEKGRAFVEHVIESKNRQISSQKMSIQEEEKRLLNLADLADEINAILNEIKYERRYGLLTFDFNDFLNENPVIAEKILSEPDKIFKLIKEKFGDYNLEISFKNIPKSQTVTIESLRSIHLNKIISVEGRCVSMSSVRPTIISSTYECPECGSLLKIIQTEIKLERPKRCSCGRKSGFKLLNHEKIDATNIILEDLQENTENPNTQRLKCRVAGELCKHDRINTFTPGNEIKVTGILREVKSFIHGAQTVNLGFLLEIINGELFEEEIETEKFTDEEKASIEDLANAIDIHGLKELEDSFAPDVYGYNEIKDAIILQLACKKNEPKVKKVRNKPNILLIGDPGVAKSVLANFARDITPGAKKAVGGGSSAVGITASVIKEDESMGGYRVEPGALVLAKELLVIDELNNLSDEDKPRLQEGMSEMGVSINKANIHVNLKVTAGILATANPKSGSFQKGETNLSDEFNIPAPIINRFDVIFAIQDEKNEERDKLIAEKMLKRETGKIAQAYSQELLRKFFVYVRKTKEPRITNQIMDKLKNFYAKARRRSGSFGNVGNKVIVNARFIESLIRLVKASAKLRLSDFVEEKDIKIASDVLSKSQFRSLDYLDEEEDITKSHI